ncbi:MAG TPA: hypothetical protein DIT25_00355 [Candidatus Moranbacteria bacterium]|nr:hypothetical protein [Candidatus Moranbacteria bacterium]
MLSLKGKNLGLDCEFIARGETVYEILEQMLDHIEQHHAHEWAEKMKGFDADRSKTFIVSRIKDDRIQPI